jgi:isopentenyl diphosphate isomerase/L-lactate dehydrogenase-like FMN-dependent dehydrogenase
VFPSYRVLNVDHYIQVAREAATRLPASTHTLSDTEFEQRVIRKINRLKQESK